MSLYLKHLIHDWQLKYLILKKKQYKTFRPLKTVSTDPSSMAATAIITATLALCEGLKSLLEVNTSPAGLLLKTALTAFIQQESLPAPLRTALPDTTAQHTPLPTEQPGETPLPSEQPGDTPLPSEQPGETQLPSEQPGETQLPSEQPATPGITPLLDLSLSIIQATPQPLTQRRPFFNHRSRSPHSGRIRDSQTVFTTITVNTVPVLTAGEGIVTTVDPVIGEAVIGIAAAITPLPVIVVETEVANDAEEHIQQEEGMLNVPANGQQRREQRREKSAIWERRMREHLERRKREAAEERKDRMKMLQRWR